MSGVKRLPARFFQQASGAQPVRDWLLALAPQDRKRVGDDIRTAEFGRPVGMPLSRALGQGLWEVRTDLAGNRIARVFFCEFQGEMILLHAIIKKTKQTPTADLQLAHRRRKGLQ